MKNVSKHEMELTKYALEKLSEIPEVIVFGPGVNRTGVISFKIGDVPAHDVATIMDTLGVEVRSGFNCAEPLADFLGTGPLVRASFYIYNTKDEIQKFIDAIGKVKEVFRLTTKAKGLRQIKSVSRSSFSVSHP